jgi:hypothetical protein
MPTRALCDEIFSSNMRAVVSVVAAVVIFL